MRAVQARSRPCRGDDGALREPRTRVGRIATCRRPRPEDDRRETAQTQTRTSTSGSPATDRSWSTPTSGERKTRGGLLIPATAAPAPKRCVWGEVNLVGPDVRAIEQGDRVLYLPQAGLEVELDGHDHPAPARARRPGGGLAARGRRPPAGSVPLGALSPRRSSVARVRSVVLAVGIHHDHATATSRARAGPPRPGAPGPATRTRAAGGHRRDRSSHADARSGVPGEQPPTPPPDPPRNPTRLHQREARGRVGDEDVHQAVASHLRREGPDTIREVDHPAARVSTWTWKSPRPEP